MGDAKKIRGNRKVKNRHEQPVDAEDFTARSYQEQLFDMARSENTIVCLNTGSGKTFIAVMLIKEMAEDVRKDYDQGGKRTFFVVPKVALVSQQAAVVRQHTDLVVKQYIGSDGVDRWSPATWRSEFREAQVLVMTAQILLDILQHGFMKIEQINLIVFDECHHTTKNNPYAQIMRLFTPDLCPLELQPRILGLSASLVNDRVQDADELETKINDLEKMLHCRAATAADFGEVEFFSTKPLETIQQYTQWNESLCHSDPVYADGLALYFKIENILRSVLDFIDDFGDGSATPADRRAKLKPLSPSLVLDSLSVQRKAGAASPIFMRSPAAAEKDAPVRVTAKQVRCVLLEVLDILVELGAWCAGCAAKNHEQLLLQQLERAGGSDVDSRRLIQLVITHMQLVVRLVDKAKDKVGYTDDLLALGSTKVRLLVNILRSYKPIVDFEIAPSSASTALTPAAGDARPAALLQPSGTAIRRSGSDSDLSLSDYSDDDSLQLSQGDTSSSEDQEQTIVFRKRIVEGETKTEGSEAVDSDPAQELSICGVVFVVRRMAAVALHKYVEEMCIYDEDLYFIRSGYVVGHGVTSMSTPEGRMGVRKQELALKRFRNKSGSAGGGREVNLLIATSVIEEGVDVPKCNLVAMFDEVNSYRQYVQTKGRARAQKSRYYMMVESMMAPKFVKRIENFRRMEKLLRERCVYRRVPTAEEIAQHAKDVADELPPYMPNPTDGAPRVTMTSAIGLVNRYCSRLPCDRFTRLAVTCIIKRVFIDEVELFEATLRLPINSSVKRPVQGQPMRTSKLAKMAAALEVCKLLHQNGELNEHLLPLGKDVVKYRDVDEEYQLDEANAPAGEKPGSSKRKQLYEKKIATVYAGTPLICDTECYLYAFELSLAAPLVNSDGSEVGDDFVTDHHPQTVGFVTAKMLPPQVPVFSVFTRSGEENVRVVACSTVRLKSAEMARLRQFHHFVFRCVLCLEKSTVMSFDPEASPYSLLVVPTKPGTGVVYEIDWSAVSSIEEQTSNSSILYATPLQSQPLQQQQRQQQQPPQQHQQLRNSSGSSGERGERNQFVFRAEDFECRVVVPTYRRVGQVDGAFYVSRIRSDLSLLSRFPTAEYATFDDYYRRKYGLMSTDPRQPLLDVTRTPARLNLLTPRNVNQKGVVLPSPKVRTACDNNSSGNRQQQQLVPEFCEVHACPASLWRKIVCLPTALYRLNGLLLCEEIRVRVAKEAAVGMATLPSGYVFPRLEFIMPCADDDDDEQDRPSSLIATPLRLATTSTAAVADVESSRMAALNMDARCSATVATAGRVVVAPCEGYQPRSSGTATHREATPERVVRTSTAGRSPSPSSWQKSPTKRSPPGCCSRRLTPRLVSFDHDDRKDREGDHDSCSCASCSEHGAGFVGPSPSLLLYALTTCGANDFLNLERLETVGDSFLKFAVTACLFCAYPDLHEGRLSYARSRQVSNYNLYRLAKKKGFGDYILSVKFEPSENWLPPGYVSKMSQQLEGGEEKLSSANEAVAAAATSLSVGSAAAGRHSEPRATASLLKRGSSRARAAATGGPTASGPTASGPARLDPRTQQRLADKNLADFVEALIGCYVVTGGPRAARGFMSWLGLHVLPLPTAAQKRQQEKRSGKLSDTHDRPQPPHAHSAGSSSRRQSVADRLMKQSQPGLSEAERGPSADCRTAFVPLSNQSRPRKNDQLRELSASYEFPSQPSPLLSLLPEACDELVHQLSGYETFEERLGYTFKDRAYLLQAFTHASYSRNTITDCYQRLEFLGDAVLDYVVTRQMFEDKACFGPGELTDLRSALVNNTIFAMLSVKWDFNKYLKHTSADLFEAIRKFVEHQKRNGDRIDIEKLLSISASTSTDTVTSAGVAIVGKLPASDSLGAGSDAVTAAEEVEIPKVLSDLFESVAGAIFLDSGYSLDAVWRVYSRLMREPIELLARHVPIAPVRELLELFPDATHFSEPDFTVDGKVRVTVTVAGRSSYVGVGLSRKTAKVAAAKNALLALKPATAAGAPAPTELAQR